MYLSHCIILSPYLSAPSRENEHDRVSRRSMQRRASSDAGIICINSDSEDEVEYVAPRQRVESEQSSLADMCRPVDSSLPPKKQASEKPAPPKSAKLEPLPNTAIETFLNLANAISVDINPNDNGRCQIVLSHRGLFCLAHLSHVLYHLSHN